MDSKELFKKAREALTDCKLSKEAEETSDRVMLLAQINSSRVIVALSPLNWKDKASETVFKDDWMEVKNLLLLMLKVLTLDRTENPSTDSKVVSEI